MPFLSLKSQMPVCDLDHDLGVVVKKIFEVGSEADGKYFPLISEDTNVPHFK